MHELGLCDAMLRMMDKILTEEEPGAFSIRRVVLEIGELSGVVPRFMEESWKAVARGTRYADAVLEIRTEPGYADCLDCGAHVRPAESGFKCPECGGEKLKPVSGIDMTIRSIEVCEEEPQSDFRREGTELDPAGVPDKPMEAEE